MPPSTRDPRFGIAGRQQKRGDSPGGLGAFVALARSPPGTLPGRKALCHPAVPPTPPKHPFPPGISQTIVPPAAPTPTRPRRHHLPAWRGCATPRRSQKTWVLTQIAQPRSLKPPRVQRVPLAAGTGTRRCGTGVSSPRRGKLRLGGGGMTGAGRVGRAWHEEPAWGRQAPEERSLCVGWAGGAGGALGPAPGLSAPAPCRAGNASRNAGPQFCPPPPPPQPQSARAAPTWEGPPWAPRKLRVGISQGDLGGRTPWDGLGTRRSPGGTAASASPTVSPGKGLMAPAVSLPATGAPTR